MSERVYRIMLGLWLLTALVLDDRRLYLALVLWLLFEGVTNLRVPRLVHWARYGRFAGPSAPDGSHRIDFEAERALRFIVATLIGLPLWPPAAPLWWLPWFVGFALVGAGLSGICPMVLALRRLGFR